MGLIFVLVCIFHHYFASRREVLVRRGVSDNISFKKQKREYSGHVVQFYIEIEKVGGRLEHEKHSLIAEFENGDKIKLFSKTGWKIDLDVFNGLLSELNHSKI